MVKVGFVKIGNVGTSIVADLLLDERADREIDVRTVGTGAKMGTDEAHYAEKLMEWDPDVVIVISPNAALSGPKAARELSKDKPCIVISDAPSKRIKEELEEAGFGYLIITGDPMIGARREFLDPTEMALFNADVVKTLAITGALRLVQEEIDRVIAQVGKGEVVVPRIVVTAAKAVARVNFSNPYAKAKAIAAYNLAEKVAEMDVQACFIMKEREEYIPMATAAHEVMRIAAMLADEAREIEKNSDRVLRKPHAKSGDILSKVSLLDVPE
ncbi:MAG: F420-dependent methylenetetrahydromethanopterin dehydrogenase [Halobacteriota archaeon]|nr:F420-dependent methylenetetrahydromethanopterin dehydrogenase [Halobacteriota archaeon]